MSTRPSIEITDYPCVRERAAELDVACPEGLAFLPDNFASAEQPSAFRLNVDTPTLRKLMVEAGVTIGALNSSVRVPYVVNRSAGWHAPVLFVAAGLLSNDANILSVALNVLSNYITDFLRGGVRPVRVKLEVVVEKEGDRTCKRLTYEGDASGIADLESAIRRLAAD